jgi:hypothetical protein
MKSIIDNAAQNAKAKYLDEKYLFTGLLYVLTDRNEDGIYYVDVPLRNVVAMEKKKFNRTGENWRDAAQKLDCEGWSNVKAEIEHYFKSDLRENEFPAPGSQKPLKLYVTGQAAFCKLGNHRLAAAMVWKADAEGYSSELKKAKCYHYRIHPTVVPILRKCEDGKGKLYVYEVDAYQSYILYERFGFWKLYRQKRVPLSPIVKDTYDYKLIFAGPKLSINLLAKLSLNFVRIPVRVIELLLKESLVKDVPQVPFEYGV